MDTTRRARPGWNIFMGVVLMLLGLVVLGAQTLTGFATILFFGWMLIIGGLVQIISGFFTPGERTVHFVGGMLTLLVGIIVAANPVFTAGTVILLLSALLIVTGTYYVVSAFTLRRRNWGWSLTGGLLVLLFGIVLLTGWPVTGLTAIGFFIGLFFFVNGFFLVANAFEISPVREEERGRMPTMAGAKGGKTKKAKEEEEEEEITIEDRRN